MWDQLCELLTDLEYLQAKLGVLTPEQRSAPATVFDLASDFLGALEALEALPGHQARKEEVERLYRAVDVNSYVFRESPRLLLQQIVNAHDWERTALGHRMRTAVQRCPWPLLLRLNHSTRAASPLVRVLSGHAGN